MIQGWEHLVITICVCYILYYVINNSKKAKAQDKRIAKLDAGQMTDWDEYLAKLCRITGKNAHELMTIAAQEAGLNFNKLELVKISEHLFIARMVNYQAMLYCF